MNTLSSIEREREEERDTDDKIEIHDGIAARRFITTLRSIKNLSPVMLLFILEVKAQKTKVNHMRDERIPH